MVLGDGGQSLAIDSKGNLIACDDAARTIDVFAPGAAKPARTIDDDCSEFALSADEMTLFATNDPIVAASYGGPMTVRAIQYSTGKVLYVDTQGLQTQTIAGLYGPSVPGGLAVSPPAPFGPPYR
jgi:sugar lactone lactonase YvrE